MTFTHTFADGETFADVTLSEGNAPDPTASPASQSCDASLTCQTTPSGPWTQSAPFVSNAVQPTETITLKPGDNLNADNFGNYIAATAPGVSKTALGGYTDTFTWTITKSVDKTTVETSGTTATFNYTITVTHDAGTVTGVNVGGIITVTNSNVDSHGNVVHINIDGITDQLSDGTTCSVTSGGAQTLTLASTTFAYTCSLSALPSGSLTNTVTVSWSTQSLSNGATLVGGSNPYTSATITFTPALGNGIATITDTFKGTLGVINAFTDTESGTGTGVTVGHPSSGTWTFSYSRVITVTPGQCKSYDNTATITETGQNSSETVTVCGTGTGALTMGFWKNTNGQKIITSYCGGSGTSLYTFLTGYNPYKDLSSSTCSKIATYVSGVISAATCSSSSKTCNTMLRAQMLATALDVYFSDPSLGGDKIAAYNGGNTTSLGPVAIDLSHICNMTDGSTGSTCTGVYEDARPEFGIVSSCLGTTVSQMLGYANANFPSSPNGDPVATATSGATWYKQIKSRQVIGKDGFDNINNQIANIDAGTVCSPSF